MMNQDAKPHLSASRHAWLSAGAPILGLVALVSSLALFLLVDFARQQDRDYSGGTRQLVSSALEARAKALGALSIDYANWDAAYDSVTRRFDAEWLEGNFYSSVVDAMIVFRPGQPPPYVWYMEEEPGAQRDAMTSEIIAVITRVPNLNTLTNTPDAADGAAHTLALIRGRLAVIAVAPITPEDDAARVALSDSNRVDYLVSAQFLDSSKIAALGESLTLTGLSFSPFEAPGDAVAQPLVTAGGATVGVLQWTHTHPGRRGLAGRMWLVFAGLVLAGTLTFLLVRALVERQLATMVRAESAVESSRLKSEFIATMSHELRTPLNAIIGYAELIQEEAAPLGETGAVMRQDSDRIIAAGRHLSQLINDILDQSRLDAGRLLLQVEPLNVENLLAEIVELVEPLTDAKNNNVTISVGAGASAVLADHTRVRQCLLNLVGNAAKFTQDGVIALRARRSEDGGFVIIDVADTGIGMSPAEAAGLFSPFVQANESIQGAFGGAGLGLAISRKLARAMGGDISVISEQGKGAMFSLTLPAVLPAAVLEAA